MPLTPVSLGVRSNQARDTAISAAKLVNAYAEDVGEEGKIKYPIVACDGFDSFSTLTGVDTGGLRAGLALTDSALYVVTGSKVRKVNASGVETQITGSVTATGLVTMARNRKATPQIGIVAGGTYYTLESDTLTDQTTLINSLAASGSLTSIDSVDGYGILFFDSGEFFLTSIDEWTAIDSLDFAAAEANPDGGRRVIVRGRNVIFAGPKSLESWLNTGATDFPFERQDTSNIGCYAAGSMVALTAVIDGRTVDTIAWAATNSDGSYSGVMLLTDGLAGSKISTLAVDRDVESVTDPTTIRAFTWARGGHVFYVITDLSTFTHAYDTTTGFWHERTSSGLDFWRVSMAVAFGSKIIAGDYTLANLYHMRDGINDSINPSVLTLKHSNDNGDTWAATRTKTLSGSADRKQRVKINRLGQSKEDGKLFNIAISHAVMENGQANDMIIQPPAIQAWPNPMRFYGVHIDTVPGVSQTSRSKAVAGLAVDAVSVKG